MDFDKGIISLILKEGKEGLIKAQRAGISPSIIQGPASAAFEFIAQHHADYGSIPSADVLQWKLGFETPEPPDAVMEFVIAQIARRHLWTAEQAGIKEIAEYMKAKDPEAIRDRVFSLANELRILPTSAGGVKAKPLFGMMEQVRERYEQTEAGIVGVPLRWPSVNAFTMGLWPETVTLFLARPGTGKSYLLTISSLWAHSKGYKVLLNSPEMGADENAERAYAMLAGVSYGQVVSGELSHGQKDKFYGKMEELAPAQGLWCLDKEDAKDPDLVEQAVMDLGVDVVFLDAVYDMRIGKGTRLDRMSGISEWLRGFAHRTKVAVAASSQLNLSGTAALSDQTIWDAHNVIHMRQTADMREMKVLDLEPEKVRRGAHRKKVRLHWDFDQNLFDEVGTEDMTTPSTDSDDDLSF